MPHLTWCNWRRVSNKGTDHPEVFFMILGRKQIILYNLCFGETREIKDHVTYCFLRGAVYRCRL